MRQKSHGADKMQDHWNSDCRKSIVHVLGLKKPWVEKDLFGKEVYAFYPYVKGMMAVDETIHGCFRKTMSLAIRAGQRLKSERLQA